MCDNQTELDENQIKLECLKNFGTISACLGHLSNVFGIDVESISTELWKKWPEAKNQIDFTSHLNPYTMSLTQLKNLGYKFKITRLGYVVTRENFKHEFKTFEDADGETYNYTEQLPDIFIASKKISIYMPGSSRYNSPQKAMKNLLEDARIQAELHYRPELSFNKKMSREFLFTIPN